MTNGIGLLVRFELRDDEAAAAFDDLVGQTLAYVVHYVVHAVPDKPNVRVFYELYADRDAFDQNEQQPHTKHFLAQREQYLSGVDVTFLSATAGRGSA